MPDARDNAEPSTATATDFQHESALTILRWIYPECDQLTALSDRTVVIGRDSDCTTSLASTRISRKHADVKPVGDGYLIRDLGSKNGLFLNAKRVQKARLRLGDVVRLGDFIAIVELASPLELSGFRDLGHAVFGGAAMRGVLQQARQAASRPVDLVLIGERGTGKKLLARAIHRLSGRAGPCVVFEASACPRDGLLSELFGRGASADAASANAGQLQAARAGTLVLEEAADLPLELQRRLSFIRSTARTRSGQDTEFDCRLIATSQNSLGETTPRPLDLELRAKLEGAVIVVPPLRKRRADIVPLFVRLLARHTKDVGLALDPDLVLDPELLEHLCLLDWPMNVLELDNVARRLAPRFSAKRELRLSHFLELTGRPESNAGGAPRRRVIPYAKTEMLALTLALERNHGNLTKAANELGITRAKAYRMLRRAKS